MSINKHFLEKTGDVTVQGGSLHYRYYQPHDEEKAKRTPLVILHGGPGCSHVLCYDGMHPLSDERPTLYYDQRGSHYSKADSSDAHLTMDQFVDDLHALVTDVGLESFALLGHSFGGALALAYALKNPNQIKRLLLSSPLISSKVWEEDGARLIESVGYDAQKLLKLELSGQTEDPYFVEAIKAYEDRYAHRSSFSAAAFKTNSEKFSRDVYISMWGASELACTGSLADLDFFPRLSELKIPTAILCGSDDSATPQTMKRVQAAIDGATLTIIPDSGHVTYIANQDAFVDAVNGFLSGV